jgi:hypothetical protein
MNHPIVAWRHFAGNSGTNYVAGPINRAHMGGEETDPALCLMHCGDTQFSVTGYNVGIDPFDIANDDAQRESPFTSNMLY